MSDLRDGALAAEALLLIDSAREYGLIEGGPVIIVERCEEVIAQAKAAGITYDQDEIDAAIIAMLGSMASTPRPATTETPGGASRPHHPKTHG